ncbi:hypothetical protein [Clostridium novyi]|uniref:hypothetical protein n=1 Tax=Clostridium novyi TaxID=1542 RepID=UPI001FA8038B|nr:hypothetical protein [Clostridium novyi]
MPVIAAFSEPYKTFKSILSFELYINLLHFVYIYFVVLIYTSFGNKPLGLGSGIDLIVFLEGYTLNL